MRDAASRRHPFAYRTQCFAHCPAESAERASTHAGGDDFLLDLLFYHLKVRRYMVIELKADRFRPERFPQLGFYLTAVGELVKDPIDGPTIGLLLCKSRNEIVAEYALRDNTKPPGVAECQRVKAVPDPLQRALPTIEQIERDLGG